MRTPLQSFTSALNHSCILVGQSTQQLLLTLQLTLAFEVHDLNSQNMQTHKLTQWYAQSAIVYSLKAADVDCKHKFDSS